MTSKNLVLVSGANGHLGNNLVRLLIKKDFRLGLRFAISKTKTVSKIWIVK